MLQDLIPHSMYGMLLSVRFLGCTNQYCVLPLQLNHGWVYAGEPLPPIGSASASECLKQWGLSGSFLPWAVFTSLLFIYSEQRKPSNYLLFSHISWELMFLWQPMVCCMQWFMTGNQSCLNFINITTVEIFVIAIYQRSLLSVGSLFCLSQRENKLILQKQGLRKL